MNRVFQLKITTIALMLSAFASAQMQDKTLINPVKASPSSIRTEGSDERTPFKKLPMVNIGPTIMGGRVVDMEVNPENPLHFYVAFASGGLWETTNNGQSFTPIFDTEQTLTIGDVAVHWPSKTIYVGTGEVNSSRSSYAGLGVYKSTDNGKSWRNMGLPESHHIGRIVIDEQNPDLVWVAVLGHLYSPNKERGIYMSHDGGKSWKQTLFINENTGCVTLVQDPSNASVLYASAWERTRRAWNFWEAGEGSGVYKSTDAGKTWKPITSKANGFPVGKDCGRIGLALYHEGNKEVLYALVDNQGIDSSEKPKTGFNRKDFKEMNKLVFNALGDSLLDEFLVNNNFSGEFTAKRLKDMVRKDSIKPADLYHYLTDANTDLFEAKLIGLELFKSENGGQSWERTHRTSLNKVAYTYGYYFGLITVSPSDPDELYIAGVPLLRSADGGKSFEFAGGDNVHVDHHALWINPKNPNHIINGNDGGVVISYDKGKNWIRCNHPAVGQFYSVYADNKPDYHVYGGLQDNGVWKGSPNTTESRSWQMYGQYPYQMLIGGDGMQVVVDEKEDIVYTGYQFGHYSRIHTKTQKRKDIMPKHTLGEKPLRFNWQSPIWLSVHNRDILYFGSNKVHRSLDKGDNWQTISPDLSNGGVLGDVSFGTISSLHESDKHFGWLLAGTDDGHVYLTKNGGETWLKISEKLPANLWVSRVRFSVHNHQTLYVSLNGYRWDNFESHLYKSTDLGKTWTRLKGLPHQPVNGFAEDLADKNTLYVATDNGLYITTDMQTFKAHPDAMPKVAVHDVYAHASGNVFVGTHGRSLYKLNAAPIRSYEKIKDSTLYVWQLDEIKFNKNWGAQQFDFSFNQPQVEGLFYVSKSAGDSAMIEVKNEQGWVLNQFKVGVAYGYNPFTYDLTVNSARGRNSKQYNQAEDGKYYLVPGNYELVITYNATVRSTPLEVSQKKKK